jgi:hypothetical protein
MPYPESCPECGGTFRNSGTHFTARRNEVGRHVLLELGCQNTSTRFWWNFTTGKLNEEARSSTASAVPSASHGSHADAQTRNGNHPARPGILSGHVAAVVATLDPPTAPAGRTPAAVDPTPAVQPTPPQAKAELDSDAGAESEAEFESESESESESEKVVPAVNEVIQATPEVALPSDEAAAEANALPAPPASLKEAFIRQLQLDRLTLRQMRSLLMSDEARRSIEVAAGATEATYERLALILFGTDLPQLLGKETPNPVSTGMSAEERLELQREKARIRARLRRAAIKAARSKSQ